MHESISSQVSVLMHLSMYCPRYHPMGKVWGFDKINCLSPEANIMIKINAPLGMYTFALLSVNIDQIPLIWGTFIGQMRSNPHLFASRGVGGAIH